MNRIKELRKEKALKQEELAQRLQINRQAISKYELGTVDLNTDTIRRLCEIFGCTSDYLLGLSDQREKEISDEDAAMLRAYHAAPISIRAAITTLLQPYIQEEKRDTAAG